MWKILPIVLSRAVWVVPTLLGLIVITFVLSRVIPADPVALAAGEAATVEQVEALRVKLGYDRPILAQFGTYLGNVFVGDLGRSLFTDREIVEDLADRLPATIELTLVSMFIAIALGIPLGILSAVKRNSLMDHLVRILSVGGLAVASFWLAIMLQLLFSMRLGWLPLSGRYSGFAPESATGLLLLDALLDLDFDSLSIALQHITLPALTLAIPSMATIVRFTRAGVLEVLNSGFVMYERAMGFPESTILFKYVFRNALTSTVTQIGLVFGLLLAGAVVIEAVFNWPGIGLYAYNSILQSDYNAIMGFTLWAGGIFIFVNLIVDIVHSLIDPRGTA
ncbi:MAG: ABC transporter permease [Hyphomicrobiales bacterium]|nr:ABC transporter permease [Hyphomicrobiales bacterium]